MSRTHEPMLRAVLTFVLVAGLLVAGAPAAQGQAACSVPRTQAHRGITATFTLCLDRTFTLNGQTHTVHVYYTETDTPADATICAMAPDADNNGVPDLTAPDCEHRLVDDDDANGDNIAAVAAAEETRNAWRFFRQRDIPVLPGNGTEMTVFLADDRRGGGVPTDTSLWWDDELVSADGAGNFDVLMLRILAYHEIWHLVQGRYGGAGGSHSEGVARAIEDRVDPALDADTGHLFIPEFSQHVATEGPVMLPDAPRGRRNAMEDLWYWSSPWWTWFMDHNRDAGEAAPVLGWNALEAFYEELRDGAPTEFDALDEVLTSRGSSFVADFLDYTLALYAYTFSPTDERLRFLDSEVTASTGGLRNHTVRTGAPAPTTDT
jgi:hypothetical protein